MTTSPPSGFSWMSVAVLVGSLIICIGGGFASGISTIDQIDGWYATLDKPFFNPPNWIFSPVWTLLYTLMGLAFWGLWRVSRDAGELIPSRNRGALGLFIAQFVVNLIWSPVFFGAENLGLALVIILAMWVLIALTIRAFWAVRPWTGLILLPYIAWVSFATLLNATLLIIN